MERKHQGALSELKAVCWLLEQGYEVFRNVSPHGSIDIIARHPKTEELMFVDVKTGIKYTCKDGRVRYSHGISPSLDESIKVLSYFKEDGTFMWRE